MKDYFAILKQPRRPWLNSEAVKAAFVAAAAETHPDRFHEAASSERAMANQRYTDLNEANQCLTEPHTRLRHFLELERGSKIPDLQEIPDGLLELFTRVARILKSVDSFLQKRASNSSPLIRVTLIEEAESQYASLQDLRGILQEKLSEFEQALRAISQTWETSTLSDNKLRDRLLHEMESLYRIASFQHRWLRQLQLRTTDLLQETFVQ